MQYVPNTRTERRQIDSRTRTNRKNPMRFLEEINIIPSIYLLQNDQYLLRTNIQTITAIHENIILLFKMNILYLDKFTL